MSTMACTQVSGNGYQQWAMERVLAEGSGGGTERGDSLLG